MLDHMWMIPNDPEPSLASQCHDPWVLPTMLDVSSLKLVNSAIVHFKQKTFQISMSKKEGEGQNFIASWSMKAIAATNLLISSFHNLENCYKKNIISIIAWIKTPRLLKKAHYFQREKGLLWFWSFDAEFRVQHLHYW